MKYALFLEYEWRDSILVWIAKGGVDTDGDDHRVQANGVSDDFEGATISEALPIRGLEIDRLTNS